MLIKNVHESERSRRYLCQNKMEKNINYRKTFSMSGKVIDDRRNEGLCIRWLHVVSLWKSFKPTLYYNKWLHTLQNLNTLYCMNRKISTERYENWCENLVKRSKHQLFRCVTLAIWLLSTCLIKPNLHVHSPTDKSSQFLYKLEICHKN